MAPAAGGKGKSMSNGGNRATGARCKTKGAINSNVASGTTAETQAVVHPALTLLVGDISTCVGRCLGGEVNRGVTTGSQGEQGEAPGMVMCKELSGGRMVAGAGPLSRSLDVFIETNTLGNESFKTQAIFDDH